MYALSSAQQAIIKKMIIVSFAPLTVRPAMALEIKVAPHAILYHTFSKTNAGTPVRINSIPMMAPIELAFHVIIPAQSVLVQTKRNV